MASRARTPTLWELGHHPGRLVVRFCVFLLVASAGLSLLLEGRLGLLFDIVFVGICVVAPLWVRVHDFFTVGVLPPLLLAVTVVVLAAVARGSVAQPHDSFGQAVVSGLAHHGIALSVGYGCTLLFLGLRQVALRNDGVIRPSAIRAVVAQHPDRLDPGTVVSQHPRPAAVAPADGSTAVASTDRSTVTMPKQRQPVTPQDRPRPTEPLSHREP